MASKPIYEFYLELEEFEPKIWRRIQVLENMTMNKFAYVIMVLFEMTAQHLFSFSIPVKENMKNISVLNLPNTYVGIENLKLKLINEDEVEDINNAPMSFAQYLGLDNQKNKSTTVDVREMTVKDVFSNIDDVGQFWYDFRDDWFVKIKLEKVFKDTELNGRLLPRILEGENLGIIENCGGVDGLTNLFEAFKLGHGEEYEEYSEWLGIDDLSVDIFDIDDLNFRLQKLPKVYAKLYEEHKYPTKQAIDIINRAYLL